MDSISDQVSVDSDSNDSETVEKKAYKNYFIWHKVDSDSYWFKVLMICKGGEGVQIKILIFTKDMQAWTTSRTLGRICVNNLAVQLFRW